MRVADEARQLEPIAKLTSQRQIHRFTHQDGRHLLSVRHGSLPQRPLGLSWRLRVVAGSKAAVDVVVDHADVLHERIHARGPHEPVSL